VYGYYLRANGVVGHNIKVGVNKCILKFVDLYKDSQWKWDNEGEFLGHFIGDYDDNYWIAASKLNSRDKLEDWLRHLGKKSWVGEDDLAQVETLCVGKFGY